MHTKVLETWTYMDRLDGRTLQYYQYGITLQYY
jgi:hypothetical protein